MAGLKHGIGDTVQIKSREWYDKNKDKNGDVRFGFGKEPFISKMAVYCGQKAWIKKDDVGDYELDVDRGGWFWNDLMLED